jgi:hypothetical protein
LHVEGVASGIGVVDSVKLKSKFIESGIVGGMGWNYSIIKENLRKNNKTL